MYEIYLESSAEKDLKILPAKYSKIIIPKLKALSGQPYPRGVKKLKDSDNFWRIRFGSYRVIYEVVQSSKRINIYKIKHREDAYK